MFAKGGQACSRSNMYVPAWIYYRDHAPRTQGLLRLGAPFIAGRLRFPCLCAHATAAMHLEQQLLYFSETTHWRVVLFSASVGNATSIFAVLLLYKFNYNDSFDYNNMSRCIIFLTILYHNKYSRSYLSSILHKNKSQKHDVVGRCIHDDDDQSIIIIIIIYYYYYYNGH